MVSGRGYGGTRGLVGMATEVRVDRCTSHTQTIPKRLKMVFIGNWGNNRAVKCPIFLSRIGTLQSHEPSAGDVLRYIPTRASLSQLEILLIRRRLPSDLGLGESLNRSWRPLVETACFHCKALENARRWAANGASFTSSSARWLQIRSGAPAFL